GSLDLQRDAADIVAIAAFADWCRCSELLVPAKFSLRLLKADCRLKSAGNSCLCPATITNGHEPQMPMQWVQQIRDVLSLRCGVTMRSATQSRVTVNSSNNDAPECDHQHIRDCSAQIAATPTLGHAVLLRVIGDAFTAEK